MLPNNDHTPTDLLGASEARTFLKIALEIRYRKRGRINLADFSRRAGFSSRSFISEYLSGKKGLSRESLNQLKATLKLPKHYKDLFTLLAYRDQPELINQKFTPEELEKKIAAIKSSIVRQTEILERIQNPERLISSPILFRVFAALGTEEQGATLQDIATRTKLTPGNAAEYLQVLMQEGVVVFQDDRYFSPSMQMDFLRRSTPTSLADLLKALCSQMLTDAEDIPQDPKNSLFYTAFSIQSHQLPEFKERLREAISGVLDQYQDGQGDCIHELFLCTKS
ncbi:MAG: hypothetical protein OM95_09750 [Bdellovibrio sp. ArHS]|uniref:helix-turn-helix domain-containing protein n=1 Tax=Bdellovibrio sp. ArHS TaxID=1569284 RepID=UPI000582CB3E|nr:helix-turn-helix domain-containing protein [Bdellovibrio sp. ArHS]KHD88399.1 MAG: hypothetical protein OM95_09750 [Bdellovibrio sp. ArHS]